MLLFGMLSQIFLAVMMAAMITGVRMRDVPKIPESRIAFMMVAMLYVSLGSVVLHKLAGLSSHCIQLLLDLVLGYPFV